MCLGDFFIIDENAASRMDLGPFESPKDNFVLVVALRSTHCVGSVAF